MYASQNTLKLAVAWKIASGEKDELGNPKNIATIQNTLSIVRSGTRKLDDDMAIAQLANEANAFVISGNKKMDPRIVQGSYGDTTYNGVSYKVRYIRPIFPGMAPLVTRVLGQQVRIEINSTSVIS